MKSTTFAIGMFAAVANASHFPRHFHFRRDNSTIPADGQTTLTVVTTEVATITSCAPTITDCPADQTDIDQLPESEKTTAVVTYTVALTTTVCPISEAAGISSSVISDAITNSHPGMTLTEHPVAPSATDASPEPPKTTGEDELTTTTTATTTSTITITLSASDGSVTGESGESGDNNVPSSGNGGGDGEVCQSAPTVTVTAPASTVFVTVGGCEPSNAAAQELPAPTEPVDQDEDDDDVNDDDEEDECTSDTTTTLQSTVTVPFPTGNGTAAAPTGPVPTGYARLRF